MGATRPHLGSYADLVRFVFPGLTPPRLETPEDERLAAVLIPSASAVLWLTLVLLGLMLVLEREFPMRELFLAVATFAVVLPVRAGRLRLGALALVGLVWLRVTAALVDGGTISGPAFPAYLLSVVMAGVLIDARAAVVVSLVSAIAGGAVALLGQQGLLPTDEPPSMAWNLILPVMTFVLGAALLALGARAGDRARAAQREAEDEQAASQQRLRSIAENSSDLISEFDEDLRFAYASPNHLEILGYEPADLVGRLAAKIVHPDDLARVGTGAIALFSTGAEQILECRVRHASGRYLRVECSAHLFEAEGGETRAAVVTRDLTERFAMAERLRVAQRMEAVGLLAGGVAHDFNNLLMAIGGWAQLLENQVAKGSPEWEASVEIGRATGSAAKLTQQLLAFSRRQVLAPRVVDAGKVLADLAHAIRPLVGERVRVHLERPDEELPVEVDTQQLEQVVMNLAVNARDALPDGGEFALSVVRDGRTIRIAARDDGLGMDEATAERAFEPFFTTKEPGSGTGLGLAVAHGIVHQMGGEITLSSTPGAGTTVTVELPLGEGPVEVPEAKPALAPSAPARARVVLVEDQMAVRRVLREILERSGYEVLEARDAEEALRRSAHGEPPHVLVSDVVMPGMDGIELARTLRDRYPALRVILVTGYADATDRARKTADRFLQKPFSNEELVDAVRDLVLGAEQASPSTEGDA